MTTYKFVRLFNVTLRHPNSNIVDYVDFEIICLLFNNEEETVIHAFRHFVPEDEDDIYVVWKFQDGRYVGCSNVLFCFDRGTPEEDIFLDGAESDFRVMSDVASFNLDSGF